MALKSSVVVEFEPKDVKDALDTAAKAMHKERPLGAGKIELHAPVVDLQDLVQKIAEATDGKAVAAVISNLITTVMAEMTATVKYDAR